MLPPPLVKAERTLAAVRLRLSVRQSTIIAVPFGPYPSYDTDSQLTEF